MQFNFNDYLNYSGVKNQDAASFSTIIKGIFGTLKSVYLIDVETMDVIPEDLKLAIYKHIDHVYFGFKNKTDSIDKVVNTAGNTVFFSKDIIPQTTQFTYDFYSQRQIVLV